MEGCAGKPHASSVIGREVPRVWFSPDAGQPRPDWEMGGDEAGVRKSRGKYVLIYFIVLRFEMVETDSVVRKDAIWCTVTTMLRNSKV